MKVAYELADSSRASFVFLFKYLENRPKRDAAMLMQKISSQREKTNDCQVKPPRAEVTSPLAPPIRKNRIGMTIITPLVNGSQKFNEKEDIFSSQSAA